MYAFRRDGFDGEIRVSAENLPAGVTAQPITLSAPGKTQVRWCLRPRPNAPEAVALIPSRARHRLAQSEVVAPRLARRRWCGAGCRTRPSPGRGSRAIWPLRSARPKRRLTRSTSAQGLVLEMSRMGKVKFPVNIVRRGEFKGAVNLFAFGLPPQRAAETKHNRGGRQGGRASSRFKLPGNCAARSTISFFLLGVSDVSYAQSRGAAGGARSERPLIEKLSADETAAAKAAAEAKTAADQKLAEATATRKKRPKPPRRPKKRRPTRKRRHPSGQPNWPRPKPHLIRTPPIKH